MKKGRWVAAILGLMAAAVAVPAAAQGDTGIYLGGSGGMAHWTRSCAQSNVPCDDNDVEWRAFAGYRFNRWLGAEVAYFDLGEASGNGLLGGAPASFQLEAYGFDAVAVATVQLVGQLHFVGRLGIYWARSTVNQQFAGFDGQTSAGTNHNYTFGAGLQYNLGPIGLQASWQRYDNVGTGDVEDDVDYYSLGLIWRF